MAINTRVLCVLAAHRDGNNTARRRTIQGARVLHGKGRQTSIGVAKTINWHCGQSPMLVCGIFLSCWIELLNFKGEIDLQNFHQAISISSLILIRFPMLLIGSIDAHLCLTFVWWFILFMWGFYWHALRSTVMCSWLLYSVTGNSGNLIAEL